MAKQTIPIAIDGGKPKTSPPPSGKLPRFLRTGGNYRTKTRRQEIQKRLGITAEQLVGVPEITPILKMANGGARGCIEALRSDDSPDAVTFLAKWDSLAETDKSRCCIEDVCVAAGLTTRRLLEVITGAMMTQGDVMTRLIVAAAKPKVIERMAKQAKTAKGEKDRENFLRGKQVDWFVPTKGLTIDQSDRRTQNNVLNAPKAERALPPGRADEFFLELATTMKPDQPMLPTPEPIVEANVPEIVDVQYEESDVL